MAWQARSHPVQGLVCVHGYSDEAQHLLPVDGIFVSMEAFRVRTTLELRSNIKGERRPSSISRTTLPMSTRERDRVDAFVEGWPAKVESHCWPVLEVNSDLPQGCGLGTSAATFASISAVLAAATGIATESPDYTDLVRRGSYSAVAASAGGVTLIQSANGERPGAPEALDLNPGLDLHLLVLFAEPDRFGGPKSTETIHREVVESPYYENWQCLAAEASLVIRSALRSGDFEVLGNAAEAYAMQNMAVMCTGPRGYLSWSADTVALIQLLREIRKRTSIPFFVTTNSGPSVVAYGSSEALEALGKAILCESPTLAWKISGIGGPTLVSEALDAFS